MKLFAWQGGHGNLWHPPAIIKEVTVVDKHWLYRFYWWTAFITTAFLTVNIFLYILGSYAVLPYTYVNGVNIGLQSKQSAINELEELFNNRPLEVDYQGSRDSFNVTDLGISVDTQQTYAETRRVNGLSSLPLVKLFTNPMVNILPNYQIDRQITINKLSSVVPEKSIAPVSAYLLMPEEIADPITISKSISGSEISPEIAADQLITKVRGYTSLPKVITISPKGIIPTVQTSQLASTLLEAQSLINSSITVNDASNKKITTVSSRTLKSLLTTDNRAKLVFDQAKLVSYLKEELSLYFLKEPISTRVEKGKTFSSGTAGKTLNIETATSVFNNHVLNGSKTIALPAISLEPAKIVDGVYPKTEAGLQALISDFDDERTADFRIIVHQLRGGDIRATHQGATSSIPASTYKAFIAYAVMHDIEAGKLTMQSQTPHGSVKDCMYEMIHYSTDFCARALQDLMGWQHLDDVLHEAGFENTLLNNEPLTFDKYTTTQDEYKLLRGLYDQSLMDVHHTNYQLQLMKEQKWRSGIPRGSSPLVVADKIGFYAGWINDIGIVYGKDSDYIIVALSDGGSFREINDLSRRVKNFFGE